MNSDFIHLHCHSSFSLKDGVGSPEKRVDWAVKNKKSACALSDHGNISSWMSLYSACEKNNIKPIMGCEFYFNRYADELEKSLLEDDSENIQIRKKLKYFNSHVTMFAKNETGYYNMIKIHNDAWLNRFYRFPITSPTTIQKNHDGIICLSGCSGSEANKIISKKQYLLSEKRKTDILEEIENKSFIIQQLYKDKNIDRAIKNDDFNDSDLDYFNSHTMFSSQEYQQFAKDLIEKEDLNFINQADKKVEETIDWWHNLFGQDFYIEIMVIDHTPQIHINQELIKIAQKKNIPLVITNDAHYIEKSGAKIQEFQMLNDQDKTFKELQAQESNETDENSKKIWTIKSEQLYYKTVEELKDSWEKLHKSEIFTEKVFNEAVKNSVVIADKIENFKIDKSIKLPKLSDDSKDVLWSKIENGLKNKNLDNERYRKQAEYEFDIICKKDFVDYFLITQEMIVWAKRKFGKYSVGPGRGSAAGSLCNYLLGITEVDPLKHNLLFERFLDITRNDAVDIDVDYMPSIRDEVIQHLIDKYGRESVSNICTFGISKTKTSIQDVCRVCGIPSSETIKITTSLNDVDESMSLSEIEKEYPQLKEFLDSHKEYNLRFYIENLRGAQRQISIHASGVLVSSNKLTENIALVRAKKNIVTGWQEGADYRELSDLGYYKFDILGLSHLKIMEDARKLVKQRHNINIDWSEISLTDEKVFSKTVANNDYYGVFQFETNLGKTVSKTIEPESFEDLSACSAILRPGPLQMGIDKKYAGNKNDGVWTEKEIPECIRSVLSPTRGCLVFQEQFMQIMNRIGGLSIAETNVFRKIVSKKLKDPKKEEERMKKLASYKEKFIEIASKKENIGNLEKCNEIWNLIESMASYAFNASHSVSYTYISFRELWLKTYYDLEFNVSLLNNNDLESCVSYISSIISKGYKINTPSINKGDKQFSIFNNEIVWGLSSIVGIPDKKVDEILEERKNGEFKNVEDFFNRVKISQSVADCLVFSGALDELETNQETDIFGNVLVDVKDRYSLHEYISKNLLKNKKYEKIDKPLIDLEKDFLKISFTEISNFTKIKKEFQSQLKIETDLICDCDGDGVYRIFGQVTNTQKKKTATGKDYVNFSIKDETDLLTGISIWPWKTKSKVEKNTFIFAKIEIKDGFKSLISCSKVE